MKTPRIAISTIWIPRNVCNSYIRLKPAMRGEEGGEGGERVTRPNAGVSIESRGWRRIVLITRIYLETRPRCATRTHVHTRARAAAKGSKGNYEGKESPVAARGWARGVSVIVH